MNIDYEELFKPYRLRFYDTLTDEDIKFIFESGDKPYQLFKELYDLVYGSIEEDENLIEIHTGGWSENESILSEFERTWWFSTHLQITARGGHYYLNTDSVAVKDWDIIKTLIISNE